MCMYIVYMLYLSIYLSMCIHIYVYTYIYMYTCVCVFMCVCIYIYTDEVFYECGVCVCVYICIYVCMCAWIFFIIYTKPLTHCYFSRPDIANDEKLSPVRLLPQTSG